MVKSIDSTWDGWDLTGVTAHDHTIVIMMSATLFQDDYADHGIAYV